MTIPSDALAELNLSEGQAERFLSLYLGEQLPLWDVCKMVGIQESPILEVLAGAIGVPLLKREDYPEQPVLLDGVSMRFLQKHCCLPLESMGEHLRVAIADPLDLCLVSLLERHFEDRNISLALGTSEDIGTSIDRLYGEDVESESDQAGKQGGELFEESLEHLRDLASEAPIVRRVDFLLNKALDLRASDVHFESTEQGLEVRCRVDGILHSLDAAPPNMRSAVISRLKLMAGLDIAERRLPQDGSIKWRSSGRITDIRVSTAPTLYGESVVLRLLSSESAKYELDSLGFREDQNAALHGLITQANGMILVTGPTGSGKTTTLYAILQRIKDETKKIITVEDPVEYKIDGINQIQVKPQINLTFANALRSLVRQDPDILLIGEIRDAETANIAIESALTGHLVLSTLHTKDAPGAITRLRDLETESFLIADSVLAVLAQRLVRVMCPNCRQSYVPDDSERAVLRKVLGELQDIPKLYRPLENGCEACGFTGYHGREGIFEILLMDDAVRSMVISGSDAGSIARAAKENGYRSMLAHGYEKVLAGRTTISEILRVTTL